MPILYFKSIYVLGGALFPFLTLFSKLAKTLKDPSEPAASSIRGLENIMRLG